MNQNVNVVDAFIGRWKGADGSELANAQVLLVNSASSWMYLSRIRRNNSSNTNHRAYIGRPFFNIGQAAFGLNIEQRAGTVQ